MNGTLPTFSFAIAPIVGVNEPETILSFGLYQAKVFTSIYISCALIVQL